MVGGGSCRGLDLCRALSAEGHAVRVVTRSPERAAEIEAAGGEAWDGTPDRIGTLRYALDNVTVVLWLLGTASGPEEEVGPLHGSRLKMLLERVTDSTVRGFVYEGAGTVMAEALDTGVAEVEWANKTNEIPFRLLKADPRGDRAAWLAEAREAIDSLLGGPARLPGLAAS